MEEEEVLLLLVELLVGYILSDVHVNVSYWPISRNVVVFLCSL